MKIAAITRFKQGILYEALRKLGWSQAELARRTGIHMTSIGSYMNLKYVPPPDKARLIQNAFAEAGLFVDVENAWPERFKGLSRAPVVAQVQEVDDLLLLEDVSGLSQNALGQTVEFAGIGVEELNHLLTDVLNDKERAILEARFYEGKTLEEAGAKVGNTRERVRQIQEVALAKLRRHVEGEDKRCELERMKKANVELVEKVL